VFFSSAFSHLGSSVGARAFNEKAFLFSISSQNIGKASAVGYTKLFSDIITSTIWQEPNDCRVLWITMLALQDRDHICRATVPALAKICNITNELCEEYLTDFQQPDKYSRSQEHEGRRIEQIEGGYLILNGEYYQRLLSKEDRREYKRNKAQEYRDKARTNVDNSRQAETDVDTNIPRVDKNGQNRHTKTKTKTCIVRDLPSTMSDGPDRIAKPIRRARAQIPDSDFLNDLKTKSAYSAINVTLELEKAETWCAANHRTCTRRFFVNWLNRVEKPLGIPKPQSRVGAQAKPVAVESDRVDTAEMVSTWNDLADAMGEPLEKLVKKSVALGQLSKDDARMILGESNAQ
jgi:hypothetical protein